MSFLFYRNTSTRWTFDWLNCFVEQIFFFMKKNKNTKYRSIGKSTTLRSNGPRLNVFQKANKQMFKPTCACMLEVWSVAVVQRVECLHGMRVKVFSRVQAAGYGIFREETNDSDDDVCYGLIFGYMHIAYWSRDSWNSASRVDITLSLSQAAAWFVYVFTA